MRTKKVNLDATHVVFRYVDKYGVDTVAAHESVIDKTGAVWIAKVGRSLSDKNIGSLMSQVEKGIETFLYLTKRVGSDYEAHRGSIKAFARELPTKEKTLIPGYYSEHRITDFADLWIKLSALEPVTKSDLAKLKIVSTGKGIIETFPKSVISLFLVRES